MSASTAPAPIAVLEHAAVGAPITRAGVSLFPVYLFQPLPTPMVTGRPGAIEIAEADAESVPTLTVTSVIDDPFLLVEGETVAGGLQQRTLNVSVLVPPRERLDIPVSCVEAGRWGGARSFSSSSGHVSRRVRRAKSAGVAENLRRTGHKQSDQGAVWQTVGYELDRLEVDSATCNFASVDEIFDVEPGAGRSEHARLAGAAADLVDCRPLPGQCGVVVAHGSRVVAAEVFATPAPSAWSARSSPGTTPWCTPAASRSRRESWRSHRSPSRSPVHSNRAAGPGSAGPAARPGVTPL